MARPGRKKKDISAATAAGANALGSITGDPETAATTPNKEGIYRLTIAMPRSYSDYLHAATYYSSSPGIYVSMTEYVCGLIEEDMKKHPEWTEGNKNAIKEEY